MDLSKFINQYLNKIERNLSNFHYNVIIANMYEAYAFLTKIIKEEKNYSNLISEYIKFVISILPVVPHLSNECLAKLNMNQLSWPIIDRKYLEEEFVKIVVQINGKKRGIYEAKKDISEHNLVNEILKSQSFDKMFNEKKIKKQFYVNNRLINFLI